MVKWIFFNCILVLVANSLFTQNPTLEYVKNWPQWRGPISTGVAPFGNPPTEWSETNNIKWKIKIPGRGHATPIVWDDMVFIQTAVETDQMFEDKDPDIGETTTRRGPPNNRAERIHDFVVMAVHRPNGKVLWKTTVRKEQPRDGTHRTATWASNSPVTDGQYLYAYFGSRGLYCLDFDGNILWDRDFGQMEKKNNFGEGSSPTLYKDKMVITWDHEGDSYLYILDKKTGIVLKKIPRNEATSWSSPLITEVNGKAQIITSASSKIRSYDLETGNIVWECSGMVSNVISHPVVKNNLVYLMSGHRGNALMAIDISMANGDISGSESIIWEYNQFTSYTPSPVLINDRLYFLRANNGQLSCLNSRNGSVHYSMETLEGSGTIYASPIAVQDKLYITSESGNTFVIKEGAQFEIIAQNKLDDGNFSSPAIAGNDLFIRGFQYLYCISEQ